MKTWMLTIVALVWFHSALEAAALEVAYQDKKVSLDAGELGKLPVPDNAAPFRVVIPGDSHPARWIRQVKSI
jgi:hypothetical protein